MNKDEVKKIVKRKFMATKKKKGKYHKEVQKLAKRLKEHKQTKLISENIEKELK